MASAHKNDDDKDGNCRRLDQHRNPHLKSMKLDTLYHLGLTSGLHDLKEMFGDVKYVCLGGTPQRMEIFANYIMKEINYKVPTGHCLNDISKSSHRYSMFKVGPVLSISHGMGVPSLSILLHEVIKLMWHAEAEDPVFFRLGTCGGIDLDPGTVVVSTGVVDGRLLPYHETIILGKMVKREAVVNQDLACELIKLGYIMPFPVVGGKTACTHDFYEGQARLDGAFCEYSPEEKLCYIKSLRDAGVVNIEMESIAFTALTHWAGFRSAVVCVTLVDRYSEDQVRPNKETMAAWQNRPQKLVGQFIKQCLTPAESRKGIGKSESANNFRLDRSDSSGSLVRYTSYEDQNL